MPRARKPASPFRYFNSSPEVITNDGRAAMNEVGAMLRFRQMKTLQKFASIHANIHNYFAWSATCSIEKPTGNGAPPR